MRDGWKMKAGENERGGEGGGERSVVQERSTVTVVGEIQGRVVDGCIGANATTT